jgi:hypothetical protein
VGSGDDHGARAPQELFANDLRQRAVAELALEHRFEFGVAARNGIADHHQVDVRRDVVR